MPDSAYRANGLNGTYYCDYVRDQGVKVIGF